MRISKIHFGHRVGKYEYWIHPDFCAGIGPLQLGVVLVLFHFIMHLYFKPKYNHLWVWVYCMLQHLITFNSITTFMAFVEAQETWNWCHITHFLAGSKVFRLAVLKYSQLERIDKTPITFPWAKCCEELYGWRRVLLGGDRSLLIDIHFLHVSAATARMSGHLPSWLPIMACDAG